jgi:hypothetical protein
MPPVLHQRLYSLLHNFHYYWLFVMFKPAEVRLNFIDLLKLRDFAGAWNIYVLACGMLGANGSFISDHLGRNGV